MNKNENENPMKYLVIEIESYSEVKDEELVGIFIEEMGIMMKEAFEIAAEGKILGRSFINASPYFTDKVEIVYVDEDLDEAVAKHTATEMDIESVHDGEDPFEGTMTPIADKDLLKMSEMLRSQKSLAESSAFQNNAETIHTYNGMELIMAILEDREPELITKEGGKHND